VFRLITNINASLFNAWQPAAAYGYGVAGPSSSAVQPAGSFLRSTRVFRLPALFDSNPGSFNADSVSRSAGGGGVDSGGAAERAPRDGRGNAAVQGGPEHPPKVTPVAKKEKGKFSAQINRVALALDTYDDVFSDFDSSPYKSRIISADLIREIMRRHRETKEGEIEVTFSIPERLRSRDDEAVIRTRLKDYFQLQGEKMKERLQGRKRVAIALLCGGLGLVTLHRLLLESMGDGVASQIYKWFENPTELMGWIATWHGIDRLFLHRPEELIEQVTAFERFSRASFVFVSEETLKKGMGAR